jgi:hypothetical protein
VFGLVVGFGEFRTWTNLTDAPDSIAYYSTRFGGRWFAAGVNCTLALKILMERLTTKMTAIKIEFKSKSLRERVI